MRRAAAFGLALIWAAPALAGAGLPSVMSAAAPSPISAEAEAPVPIGAKEGDPISDAGVAYRQALEALEAQNYEGAVQLLRGALQQFGEESDELKYRDRIARRRHSYYPYFEWARARVLQQKKEASIYARRDLLQDAIGRLGQTRHPDGKRLLEEAKAELADVEGAISLDGSFTTVKTRIELIATGEKFVEAFRQLEAALLKYKTREKEITDLRAVLVEKQVSVVKRYEQLMNQRLTDVMATDPIAAGDSIVPVLNAALIPLEVVEKPGPTFEWLQRFIATWEKQSEGVRRAAELKGLQVNAAAESLEAASQEALNLGLIAGFRAARHLAHAARMAKLRDIAEGAQDTFDLATAESLLRSAGDGAGRAGEIVSARDRDDIRTTLENDLSLHHRQLSEISKKIEDGSNERKRLTSPILKAEEALMDGDTLGNAEALAKLRNDLFELESEATFGTLTAKLRARALFAHALAEAMLAYLEGKAEPAVLERCRLPAWRAYGFDPNIESRWNTRMSPKLLKLFAQIKPQ